MSTLLARARLGRATLHALWMALTIAACSAAAAPGHAEAQYLPDAQTGMRFTYEVARRDPWKAIGWDLLLPGAGSVYAGLYANTIVAAVLSVTGVALWVHGGLRDNDASYWSGVGLFAAGRTYGIVSAGVGAALLNRALRRHLHLAIAPTGVRLRF